MWGFANIFEEKLYFIQDALEASCLLHPPPPPSNVLPSSLQKLIPGLVPNHQLRWQSSLQPSLQ